MDMTFSLILSLGMFLKPVIYQIICKQYSSNQGMTYVETLPYKLTVTKLFNLVLEDTFD